MDLVLVEESGQIQIIAKEEEEASIMFLEVQGKKLISRCLNLMMTHYQKNHKEILRKTQYLESLFIVQQKNKSVIRLKLKRICINHL